VTVTVVVLWTVAGAVYRPELEIVPTVALPPVTPFTCQVTAVLLVFTVAVNCCVPPVATVAEVGEMVTFTGIGGCVFDTTPQPVLPNPLTPIPARKMKDVRKFLIFCLKPRSPVFMAS